MEDGRCQKEKKQQTGMNVRNEEDGAEGIFQQQLYAGSMQAAK